MSFETDHSTNSSSYLQATITNKLGTQLDAFGAVQQNFFEVCREYNDNVTSDQYWEVEHAGLLLEFSVSETMQAISTSQKYSRDKLKMAYGFRVAEDTMRVEVFRDLAPYATFKTYQEDGGVNAFDHSLKNLLRKTPAEELLGSLIATTLHVMRNDVVSFCEVVATSKL